MEHGLFLASGIVIHHHARKSTPQLEIEWVTFGEHRWVISRECRSREPITGLLQSVASGNRELGPWIPYWRLRDRGGILNWTCPLDNQSTPPDRGTMAQMAAMGMQKSPELHSWLYPGTPGWFMPTAIRI
jgi:hypothetical protein